MDLSVVIPFVNGMKEIRSTLDALGAQRADVDLEALVVERVGEPARSEVRALYPWATLISVPSDTPIPAMRARAFQAATKSLVAVIEDHVVVPPGWARALCASHSEATPVVGGAVVNAATEKMVDRAAFLCEYSHCLPPLPRGPVDWLTGNNVVYPRELLRKYRDVVEAGGWENRLHDALRADGIPLVCHPEITVGHKMHYSVALYTSQRYLYSRSYAGTRASGLSFAKRMVYAAATAALPAVLLARIAGRVRRKATQRGVFVQSLPLLALFVVAWAAGEMVGYLLGPGRSLSKVR